jgi:hypothetical protein
VQFVAKGLTRHFNHKILLGFNPSSRFLNVVYQTFLWSLITNTILFPSSGLWNYKVFIKVENLRKTICVFQLHPRQDLSEIAYWFIAWVVTSFATITKSVSHCGLAIYIKKYLKAKEDSWKLKNFTMQKYNLHKNPLKETKILQDIITL